MPLKILSVSRFEHLRQPVISRPRFLVRMLIAIGLWIILTIVGLAIGIAGYCEVRGHVIRRCVCERGDDSFRNGTDGRIEDHGR